MAHWAAKRGVAFKPAKSNLIHFRRCSPLTNMPVQPGSNIVAPKKAPSFFKLNWAGALFAAHDRAVRDKLETQINALTRLAGPICGRTVPWDWEISVHQSAGALHQPHRRRFAEALVLFRNAELHATAKPGGRGLLPDAGHLS